MKKMMILAMMTMITVAANAMSYIEARNDALFLSDKMAYELNLTAAQFDAVYEINLDYLMSLNGRSDVFGISWDRRNTELRYVLNTSQYNKYKKLAHFYRPVTWKSGSWTYSIYTRYDRDRFYNPRPKVYVTYTGGNKHRYVAQDDRNTWRHTNANNGKSFGNANRQVAQAKPSQHNVSSNFGARR